MLHSLLLAIGSTPLVRLQHMAKDIDAEIWVKLENRNPGGSVKDRIAVYMVQEALRRGDISAGGTLVEPTSGNTGIGLALVSAVLGLRCILTMPESMSLERRKLLAQFGAELVLTPASEGMAGAVRKAENLVRNTSNAYMPGQFSNPDVVAAHYKSTGPEIWHDTTGNIAAFITGVGTGGTVTGTGKYLKDQNAAVEVWAVEPEDSPLLSQGKAGPHSIQGIGANFVPEVLDQTLLDGIMTVSGDAAIQTARELFCKEGINCGISSGANVWAALSLARQPRMRGKRIVTIICDTGERYLSTALFA